MRDFPRIFPLPLFTFWLLIFPANTLLLGQDDSQQHQKRSDQPVGHGQHEQGEQVTDHTEQDQMQAGGMGMAAMGNSVGMFGSGTSLEPMSTMASMSSLQWSLGEWALNFHANAFILDTQQTGPRGHDKFFSANWFMPMLSRQMGSHIVMFRSMFSLEAATVTDRRYPLLFQTGETAFGLPVIDGQHPHDLFMELAGMYSFQATENTQLFIYGGPVGEPAVGPTAFPHRASASENPLAVLGHHQQDSTHIANSVITLGFVYGLVQLEASTFKGREPGENRWDIDGGAPDSFASRISFSPWKELMGQFSIARINNREALEPELDTFRITSSIHHFLPVSRGHLASSVIWGRNKDLTVRPRIFNTYTLESTLKFLDKNWVWTRIENLDRDRTLLFGETPEVLEVEEDPIGRVQAFTLGYERGLPQLADWLSTGLGFQFTLYGIPQILESTYGDNPAGFQLFLRFRPEQVGSAVNHLMP